MPDDSRKSDVLAPVGSRNSSRLIIALIITGLVLLAVPYLLFRTAQPFPQVPVPTDNGYDDLVEVGKQIRGLPDNYDTAERAEDLIEFVAAREAPLKRLRRAADKKIVVDFRRLDPTVDSIMEDFGSVRQSHRLLMASARLKQLQGDPNGAAEELLTLYQLARKSATGGLLCQWQGAIAYERYSLQSLADLAEVLSPQEREAVVNRLNSMGSHPVGELDSYFEREAHVQRTVHGWKASLARWMGGSLLAAERKAMESRQAEISAWFNLVVQELSAND